MLKQRMATGLTLAALMVAAVLWLSAGAFALALFIVVLLGALEWMRLTGLTTAGMRLTYLALLAACTWLAWQAGIAGQYLVPLVIGSVWWLLVVVLIAVYQTGMLRGTGARLGLQLAGFTTLIPAWLALVLLHQFEPRLLLFLFALIWLSDSAGYFVGKSLGRTHLAPAISPAKTREGLLGALAVSALLALAGAWWLVLPVVLWPYFVALCLITTLLSVTGDLFESLLKRHAGAKDSGSLLPGHGGVLDRIDSIAAAAPAFALGLKWMH